VIGVGFPLCCLADRPRPSSRQQAHGGKDEQEISPIGSELGADADPGRGHLGCAAGPPPLTTTPALVWEAGDLAAKSDSTIVVTATVDPAAPLWSSFTNTASIGATSPELETANNQASAAVFVGRRTYLPLVFKVW